MKLVNHINYPDAQRQVFCRRTNGLLTLDNQGKYWDTCSRCPMFNGDYQGEGIECLWEDTGEDYSAYVADPIPELERVTEAIKRGKLRN